MKRVIMTIALLLACTTAGAATLLYSEDFEGVGDNDWKSNFRFSDGGSGDYLCRVTSNAYNGTYSLRLNQIDDTFSDGGPWESRGAADPISGCPGEQTPLAVFPGEDMSPYTADGFYFKFAFRHDDYNIVTTPQARKLLYFYDNQSSDGYGTLLVSAQNATDPLRLAWSNGHFPDTWATTNWGYKTLYMTSASSQPKMGAWQVFEMYVDRNERTIQMWVDGVPLQTSSSTYKANFPSYHPEGGPYKFYIGPDYDNIDFSGMRFIIASLSSDYAGASDGTEYLAGFQIDDVEIWDGIPSESSSLTAPTNLQVNGGN